MECCKPENLKGMKKMMQECMKKCKWCPLILLTLGVIFFLLGYSLSAEILRILWLVLAGFGVLIGAFCLIMTNLMTKK